MPTPRHVPHHTSRRRPPLRGPVAALAALTAAAVLAGCGGGADPTPAAARSAAAAISRAVAGATSAAAGSASAPATASGATPDLCTVVTASQATGLVHVGYDTTQTENNGDYHACRYHNTGADQGNISDLVVTLTSSPGCWAAASSSDGPGTSVPGVGDAAFGYSLGLHVEHGSSCLDVEGQTLAESDGDWGADTAIARLLLQGLG